MFDFGFGIADLNGFNLFITLIGLTIAASLMAGTYPALFNSRLNPVALVKGTVRIKGTNWMTRVLTSGQFALTVIFLIAGVLFFQNIQFQDKINLGYDKDRLVVVELSNAKNFPILKNEISSNPKITSIAGSHSHVSHVSWQAPIETRDEVFDTRVMAIGDNYFSTVGLNILQGSDLTMTNDSEAEATVVVNQAFVERTGMKDPLHKTIMLEEKKRRIVGVVQNHQDDLQRAEEMEPFVFHPIEPERYQFLIVNTPAAELTSVYQYLEKASRKLFPNEPFNALYQDDIVYANIRLVNRNLGKIFLFLTILGTIMSIAGIFSLASLNITRKTKEIGVRKVLGASKGHIVALMNREFVIILSVAAVLGSAGGFWLVDTLLSFLYKHHVQVGWFPVVLCAVFIFGAGYLTTSGSILQAAGANPVDALRSE